MTKLEREIAINELIKEIKMFRRWTKSYDSLLAMSGGVLIIALLNVEPENILKFEEATLITNSTGSV